MSCAAIVVRLYSASIHRTWMARPLDNAKLLVRASDPLHTFETRTGGKAHVRKINQMKKSVTALMVFGAVATAAQQGAAGPAKQAKPGEFEVSNAVVKDLSGNNFNQAITDLDIWKQKFPDSDYATDRLYDYEQAYAKAT